MINTWTSRPARVQTPSRRGFSLIEITLALFVVGIFLLPLLQQFTSVKRYSIGARDTVIATTLLQSRLALLQSLEYHDLVSDPPGATFARALQPFPEREKIGNTVYETLIDIATGSDNSMKVIELETSFRMPGSGEGERFLTLKGFVFDDER
jgi:prepilin-type N-terminal cleavage/methylation domain-containing protein